MLLTVVEHGQNVSLKTARNLSYGIIQELHLSVHKEECDRNISLKGFNSFDSTVETNNLV